MVDPEEGADLKFIPTRTINGVKCSKLEKEDVEAEIEYWQQAVLWSVLGANPPFEVIKGFINRIWASMDIDKIIHDKQTVEKRGVYFVDSKPFFVKGWNPEMDVHTETIQSLPLWVQFPDLDVKYWGTESLSKLGSVLGIPIKTDRFTKEKTTIKQQVVYEWKPVKCANCHMYGHEEQVCRKKDGVRMEWRKVQRDPPEKKQSSLLHSKNVHQKEMIIPQLPRQVQQDRLLRSLTPVPP
ncbi:hypothetical protein Cgig2_034201 [Carnegiea gigantea]|uniref:DUF4283 domain-containing protein n=1 Tax=Carnegiea gigantea TaxID=171969 RepID=A0A9Q1K4C4_9CARY|nr:hypothetical protein Cgig2_034201 [Carnegiea gigantea]